MSTLTTTPTTGKGEHHATQAGNYFVANYPPFSFWKPSYVPDALAALDRPSAPGTVLGLYVHIPFCRKRCHFCYFKVYTDQNAAQVQRYIDTAVAKLEIYARKPFINGRKPEFIYFGGGGFYPVSGVLADQAILGLFQPGEHGSTFGGNPLAAAVARAALKVIRDENLAERSRTLGEYLIEQLSEIPSPHVKGVRGRGLLIGVELKPEANGARRFCEALQERGILAKETHEHVIRFAPPLVIDRETIDWALRSIRDVLNMQ